MTPILWAAAATGFTFLLTSLGAAVVFLVPKGSDGHTQRIFLGFAAGVMVAASVWSLLIPAIDEAARSGGPGWLPAAGGIGIGALFMWAFDRVLPHLHPGSDDAEGIHTSWRRSTLLVGAVTLHNIPEGMALGLTFALAAQDGGAAAYAAAVALAVGIGIQNVPEGAAVSLPLRQEGLSSPKAFLLGSASGLMEPIFGIATVLVAAAIAPFMPWLLAFAAGAMLFVVVEELIPAAHLGEHSHIGTLSFLVGFVVMMVLDVALSAA